MKILRRKSKKRYLGNKNVYEYDPFSVCIPAKHHKIVKPFLGKDLDIHVKTEAKSKIIILESRENT